MKAFVTRRKRLGSAIAVLVVTASAIAAVSVSGAQARSDADELKGAGSTFVAPLITAWQQKYEAAKGVKVTYNPIGSGGGIQAITNKTVDFGASDAPMTTDQFNDVRRLRPASVGALRDLGHVQPARRSGTTCTSPGRSWPTSISERSRSGTTRGSRPSTGASTFRPRTSRRSTGAIPAARRTTSRPT